MTLPSYRTPLASVVVPRFVPLGDSGLLITATPLLDPAPSGPGLAHLNYRDALAVAAANGARLPTREEVDLLHRVASKAGTEIEPVILPDAEMRAAGAKPGDPAMVTREWAEKHDGRVLAAIDRIFANSHLLAALDAPIANAGKHWIGPAPSGKAALCGWWYGTAFIQSGLGFPHSADHFDYATTTMLIRDP